MNLATKKAIGERLLNIRNKMNMNKQEFGKLIETTSQQLGRIEQGKSGLSLDKLILICEKLHLSSDYILFGIENTIIEKEVKKKLNKFSTDQFEFGMEIANSIINYIKEN